MFVKKGENSINKKQLSMRLHMYKSHVRQEGCWAHWHMDAWVLIAAGYDVVFIGLLFLIVLCKIMGLYNYAV